LVADEARLFGALSDDESRRWSMFPAEPGEMREHFGRQVDTHSALPEVLSILLHH
jgi:hypothetical protein